MKKNDELQLRDPDVMPVSDVLKQVLADSYAAYEALQDALPGLDMEQEWQWYKPHKAWFARGQHFWTTQRGTRKEKTLYWLYVYDGYFGIAIWFKEKNRAVLSNADVSERLRRLIGEAETMGKMPTFPVVFDMTTLEPLADVYTLLGYKKDLEC